MSLTTLHILGPIQERMDPKDYATLSSVCSSLELPIRMDLQHSEIGQQLASHPNDILLTDVSALATLMGEFGFSPNKRTILVSFDRENPSLENHIEGLKQLCFLISTSNSELFKASVCTALQHLLAQKLIGIDSALINKSTEKKLVRKLTNSTERVKNQEAITEFFSEQLAIHQKQMAPGISSYPKNMADVLDELLMNAIWDANKDRGDADRSISVSLTNDETISVEATCDGQTFLLSVTDSHGTFPAFVIHQSIRYCLGFREAATLNEEGRGAGLGLYLILQKVTALTVEVKRGKLTRVCAILRCDQSLRDMQKRPRTIIFLEDEQDQ